MKSEYPSDQGLSVEQMLDPTNPIVLWVILPAAALAALGLRKAAIFWIMGAVVLSLASRLL